MYIPAEPIDTASVGAQALRRCGRGITILFVSVVRDARPFYITWLTLLTSLMLYLQYNTILIHKNGSCLVVGSILDPDPP